MYICISDKAKFKVLTSDYDVLIIGAGPAGCACALSLHDSGLRVGLIDKEKFPRDKICGDAIPGQTFTAMDRINPLWGQALRGYAEKEGIHTSEIFAPNGKTITLKWKMQAYNSMRINFDYFLRNLVNTETTATVLGKKRLTQIDFKPDHVTCGFSDGSILTTGIVIGCDGANSVVARQSGGNASFKDHSSAAVRAYFSSVSGTKQGVNEFHLFKELPGYFWIFPLENGLTNVGFGISGSYIRKNSRAINLRNSLNEIITNDPGLSTRFKNADLIGEIKGFGLPVWKTKRALSGKRFMLCGDAASLIDPLQGHGIDKSVWSGLFAAEQVKKCFNANDFTAEYMSQYDQTLYKKFGLELVRSSFIMKMITRFPWLINALVQLSANQKLINWMVRKLKI